MPNTFGNDLLGKRILVVDDEVAMREVLCETLEALGAETMAAGGGLAAFEMIANSCPDAVVSDVTMPGGDGVELLRKIRKAFPAARPAVILISGYNEMTEAQALELGAQGLLAKPFALPDFRAMLVKYLGPQSDRSPSAR